MHVGEDLTDICKRGEMTCMNDACSNFGVTFKAYHYDSPVMANYREEMGLRR